MKLLTIIITCYNQQDFIEDCINSILDPSIEFIDIIIVDDGSTDESRNIINRIKNKYPFLNILYQENRGVSIARNNAVASVKTKYLTFIDGDDLVEKSTFNNILQILKDATDELDFIQYPMCFNWNSNKEIIRKSKRESIGNADYLQELITGTFTYSCCNKVFRSSLFDKKGFPIGVRYEDARFLVSIAPYIKKAISIDIGMYLYRYNPNSFSFSSHNQQKTLDFLAFAQKTIIAVDSLDYYYRLYFSVYTFVELSSFANWCKVSSIDINKLNRIYISSFRYLKRFNRRYQLYIVLSLLLGNRCSMYVFNGLMRVKRCYHTFFL